MDRFSDAGASHTAKSPLQNFVITYCEIKIRLIVLNTNKTTLFIVFELSYPSRRSKPGNPDLRPAVQCTVGENEFKRKCHFSRKKEFYCWEFKSVFGRTLRLVTAGILRARAT